MFLGDKTRVILKTLVSGLFLPCRLRPMELIAHRAPKGNCIALQ